jgi:hypothetical protein
VKFFKTPPDTLAGKKGGSFRAVRLPVDRKNQNKNHKEKLSWYFL